MTEPIKIVILDDGIEKEIIYFKQFTIVEDHKVSEKLKFETDSSHGTEVFSVYAKTLENYLDAYTTEKHDPKRKIEIIDYNYYSNADLPKLRAKDSFSHNEKLLHSKDIFQRFCKQSIGQSYKSINMSFGLGSANYNMKLPEHRGIKNLVSQGTFIATAAGNVGFHSTNDSFPTNDPYICVVGALYYKNAKHPSTGISTPGSSVWFSMPGQHLVHSVEYDLDIENIDYTEVFKKVGMNRKELEEKSEEEVIQIFKDVDIDIVKFVNENAKVIKKYERKYVVGTSFSTPYLLALKTYIELERPDLDRSNIERLLLESADVIDIKELDTRLWPAKLGQKLRTSHRNNAWSTNGVGKICYDEFGFGEINEKHLRHLTKTWKKQTFKEVEFSLHPTKTVKEGNFYSYTYKCDHDLEVFNLHITFENKKVARKEIKELSIISPGDTTSYIYRPDYSPASFNQLSTLRRLQASGADEGEWVNEYVSGSINNRATSMHFYGEGTKGDWIIKTTVPLEKQQVTFRATEWRKDNVYRYDDNVQNVEKPMILEDKNGGHDIIDLSYYKKGKVKVNLQKGKERGITFMTSGKAIKFVPIGEGTFEKVMLGPLGGKVLR